MDAVRLGQCGAALALLAVALTSLTDTGSERLRVAAPPPALPVEQAIATIDEPARPTSKSDSLARPLSVEPQQTAIQTRPIRPEIPNEIAAEMERVKKDRAEMDRLAATVRELAVDRDRLRERVAGLEQELANVTGSIGRRSATAEAPSETPPDGCCSRGHGCTACRARSEAAGRHAAARLPCHLRARNRIGNVGERSRASAQNLAAGASGDQRNVIGDDVCRGGRAGRRHAADRSAGRTK